VNHELAQPPVYYALAGVWYGLGEALGLACGHLVFSIRWLNALSMVGLVWVTYWLASASERRDPFLRLGVPLLVAFLPQDALYSISNDALSPLLAGLVLALILRTHAGPPRPWLSLLTGLVAAAAVLVKYTNCVVLIPAIALLGLDLLGRRTGARGWLRCHVLFWAAAAAPVAAWGVRNALLFGDATARRLIFETMGWSYRPLGALLDHPMFSLPGLLHFFDGLCRNFWRGRFKWGGEIMADPLADLVYVASSGVFLLVATLVIAWELKELLRNRQRGASPALRVDLGALLTVAGGVAVLAFFSVWIMTGERSVPPRDDPFFTMGRLISGCMVPFALLYLRGLGAITKWIPGSARAFVRGGLLAVILATIATSELRLSEGAVRSEYNWFRLEHVHHGPCATTSPWRSREVRESG
jgi:hypothetical protein